MVKALYPLALGLLALQAQAGDLPNRLQAVGYGAPNPVADGTSTAQKQLMAIRAAKLDAYRSLAEQLYGLRITSHTTVSALAVQHDGFRAYLDGMVRGAKVVSTTPVANGSYETVIELELGNSFYQQASRWY